MKQDAPPRISYTVPEAAKAIGLSTKQIYRLIARGDIEAKVLGGRKLIPAEVFNSLLDNAPSAAR
jgi:excisionase family DNA binding protein